MQINHQTQEYISALFGDFFKSSTGFIEIRCIKKDNPTKQYFYPSIEKLRNDLDCLENLNKQRWNIFVGVAPRSAQEGTKEAVRAVTTLWIDVDGENFDGGKEDALKRITAFPVKPSMVVDSGHGYHAYWLLSSMALVDECGIEHIENILRGIAETIGGDFTYDISRVLRLPGLLNAKDKDNPIPCRILLDYFFPGQKYRLENFEKFAADGRLSLSQKVQLGIVSDVIPPRFEKLLREHKKLRDTWEGKRKMPNDNTRSGRDMSLISQLVRLDFSNEEIAAVVRRYPHGKGADAIIPYLQHTIGKARTGIEKIANGDNNSIMDNATTENKKPSQAQGDLLLRLVNRNKDIKFFHNDVGVPYARIPINDHFEIRPLRDRTFKQWLARLFFEEYEKLISTEALKNALTILEGKAIFEGEEILLHNRVAWHEDKIWYDLADAKWRTVCISQNGWLISDEQPILFRRYNHQLHQAEPIHGDAKELLRFININDEQQKFLLFVWVISCFIPGFPHPIPNIYGPQGSAKSCLCRILRKIIDPSSVELLSFQKDIRELVQLISHHWCPFFDNVSVMPFGVSDALCKAVTGDGFSKRELYSDDDDIIYNFKRCICINGINLVASKPDLLERSILFELERVSEERRKQESDVFSEFENAKPMILGGIFDTLAKAMKIKPTIKLSSLPRMADFAVWGCAIAEALGHMKEEFLTAYYRNIGNQNEEALNESLVATAMRIFMEDRESWEGTPSDLLEQLTTTAQAQNINTNHEREWPKAANALGKRLNELKTNLDTVGIKIKRYEKNRRRMVVLEKVSENIVSTDESSGSANIGADLRDDGYDDKSNQIPEPSPQNILDYKQNDDGDDRDGIM